MTNLPLLQSPLPAPAPRRRFTRHLRLMLFRVLLCQTRAHFLVRFEIGFLAVLVAVRYAVAFEALLELVCGFFAVRT